MAAPDFIYKIVTADVMAKTRETRRFPGMPIDVADGYLHFSTAAQLGETLSLHFRGQMNLVVFSVPVAPLGEKLKWEPSRGGQLFPHLYGDLPVGLIGPEAIVSVSDTGTVTLPEWVK